jgi:hypothetical protein
METNKKTNTLQQLFSPKKSSGLINTFKPLSDVIRSSFTSFAPKTSSSTNSSTSSLMNIDIMYIFYGVLFLLVSLIIFQVLGFSKAFNKQPPKKELEKVIIVETFIDSNSVSKELDTLELNTGQSFCNHDSNTLNKMCNSLTQKNCINSDCCIYATLNTGEKGSAPQCLTGNADGATFKSDTQGNMITLDHYYYKNKCYGNCEKPL